MLSDIENLDIMLWGNNLEREREESESGNFGRKPDSPCYNTAVNQNTNSHYNSREVEMRTCALNGQSLRKTDSSNEFNRLSGELKHHMRWATL